MPRYTCGFADLLPVPEVSIAWLVLFPGKVYSSCLRSGIAVRLTWPLVSSSHDAVLALGVAACEAVAMCKSALSCILPVLLRGLGEAVPGRTCCGITLLCGSAAAELLLTPRQERLMLCSSRSCIPMATTGPARGLPAETCISPLYAVPVSAAYVSSECGCHGASIVLCVIVHSRNSERGSR